MAQDSESPISEAMVERLVHAFYARIREDALLGPIFSERISDWDPHLQQMCAFWSAVVLKSGRYRGQPMLKHLPLAVDARHFDHWLELFEATARELYPADVAIQFITPARLIASSLEMGIASGRGIVLGPGERLA